MAEPAPNEFYFADLDSESEASKAPKNNKPNRNVEIEIDLPSKPKNRSKVDENDEGIRDFVKHVKAGYMDEASEHFTKVNKQNNLHAEKSEFSIGRHVPSVRRFNPNKARVYPNAINDETELKPKADRGRRSQNADNFDQMDWAQATKYFRQFQLSNEPIPETIEGVPGGLEVLLEEDVLFLNPVLELVGSKGLVSTEFQGLHFEVYDSSGKKIFLVNESVPPCSRFIIFSKKSFNVSVYDYGGRLVFTIEGPMVIFGKNFGRISVRLGNGQFFGSIKCRGSCDLNYRIMDKFDNELCTIKGPRAFPGRDDEFVIVKEEEKVNSFGEFRAQEVPIGVVSGSWDTEIPYQVQFINKETTGMEIPPDATIVMKTVLLAAMFLIEFQWYNKKTKMHYGIIFVCIVAILALLMAITAFLLF